jgi:hypothetical protein
VGAARIREVQAEWTRLFRELAEARERGEDPAGEAAQALARRARALIEEFTGGDPGIRSSLAAMYRAEGGPQVVERHGMDVAPDVWEYMGAAMRALDRA